MRSASTSILALWPPNMLLITIIVVPVVMIISQAAHAPERRIAVRVSAQWLGRSSQHRPSLNRSNASERQRGDH